MNRLGSRIPITGAVLTTPAMVVARLAAHQLAGVSVAQAEKFTCFPDLALIALATAGRKARSKD